MKYGDMDSPDDLEITLASLSPSLLDLHLEVHSADTNFSFQVLDIFKVDSVSTHRCNFMIAENNKKRACKL
jgi:hypothetical protein